MTDAHFDIELMYGRRNDGTSVTTLRVSDRASGELLVDVSLNAEQALALAHNAVLGNIPGTTSPHLERVGKTSEHATFKVPKGAIDTGSVSVDPTAQQVRDWAAEQDWYLDWTERRTQRHNYGWAVHVTRWVDSEEAESHV